MNNLDNKIKETLSYGINVDLRRKEENLPYGKVVVYFLSSLVDNYLIIELVNSLKEVDFKNENINNLASLFLEENKDVFSIANLILDGNAAILFFHINKCFIVEVKKFPSRSIQSPEVERSVRGSKDSFNENLINNIALIRRRLRSEELIISLYQVSTYSKMPISLVYLKNKVDRKVLESIIEKINSIDVESLIMSDRALEELLINQQKYIFPLVRYTERPDVASINLMNGKIVILVDTSSNAIILPVSIFDHFKNVEEYKQNPLIGTLTKSLRLLGSLISVFLVPFFMLLSLKNTYNNEVFPIIEQELNTPLKLQVIIISIILEIIRIAIVHTPNTLISALSLLCAIVLGEVALKIGLFSSEVLLVTSLAIVCNFATPSYELSLSNRLLSLLFIISICLFDGIGFIICAIIVFIYITSIKVFDIPYLYPIIPFSLSKIKDMFIRNNSRKIK